MTDSHTPGHTPDHTPDRDSDRPDDSAYLTGADADTDAALRTWGASARATATVIRPDATLRVRRTRHWPAAISAVAVIVAVTVTAIALRAGGPAPDPSPSISALNSDTPPPAGSRTLVYRHLAVTVPSSWTVDDQQCGTPQSNTVLYPLPFFNCLIGQPAGVSWAQFRSASQAGEIHGGTTTSITVDGHAAVEVTGTYEHRPPKTSLPAATVDVPDAHASVLVVSPDRSTVDRITSALQFVDTDANGCASEADYTTLQSLPAPTMPGAREHLIPGTPTGMSVCAYDGDLLTIGVTVSQDKLAGQLATLRSLPAGYSLDPHENDTVCTSGPRDQQLDTDERVWFAVLVHYAGAPDLVLHARIGSCGYLGITNGAVVGQETRGLVDVVAQGGLSGGFPERTVPAN